MTITNNYEIWKLELKVKRDARENARLDVASSIARSEEKLAEDAKRASLPAPLLAQPMIQQDYFSAYKDGIREFEANRRKAARMVNDPT